VGEAGGWLTGRCVVEVALGGTFVAHVYEGRGARWAAWWHGGSGVLGGFQMCVHVLLACNDAKNAAVNVAVLLLMLMQMLQCY